MNYQELQEAKQTFRLHALEKEYKPLFNPNRSLGFLCVVRQREIL